MTLADWGIRYDGPSFFFRSSQETFRFDVNQALQTTCDPCFDTVRERTAAIRSVSSSQVNMHGKTFRQSASSIISSVDHRQSSSAAVSHLR